MGDNHRTDPKAEGACTLDRRKLLQAGAGLGGAALVTGLTNPAIAQGATPVRLAAGDPSIYDFVDPVELDGAAPIDLKITRKLKTIGRQPVELRNYAVEGSTGQELVGPTIRLRKTGARTIDLKINLSNELEEEMSMPVDINIPHGFNTTNLHTHGLHVSPEDPQDNVLRKIKPKTVGAYAFEIPGDHQAGTFWYHAHKHGSTAVQVGSAMAGALIVEGDIDDVPEIRATKEKGTERVFVFQQIPYVVSLVPGAPATVDRFPKRGEIIDRNTTVNGVPNPKITVKAGQVQRWRLIHAGILETLNLVLKRSAAAKPEPLYPIAIDGITLAQPGDADEPIVGTDKPDRLGPGNRMDVLIKLDNAGTYELLNQNPTNLLTLETARTQPLATIVVSEDRDDMPLPTQRTMANLHLQRPENIDPDIVSQTRTLTFNMNKGFDDIDGKKFDPTRVDRVLPLGAVEKWVLSTPRGLHPFHIHVNPFQVIKVGDVPVDPGVWWDTIIVEQGKPVTILTRYERFTGRTVLHCHNLMHEDNGMMQLVEIVET